MRAEAGGRLRVAAVTEVPDFAHVLGETGQCAAVAIDVPIGLMNAGVRHADREARKALGRRASCVFPSAIRAVLGIRDFYEACNVSFTVQGKRIPRRAFALGLRSYEVDRLMAPELQQRVVEVHPEICFWALNGQQPVGEPKRTPAGEYERLRLLSAVFDADLASVAVPKGAARDDFYDACAAAWTASRLAYGSAVRLPADPPVDARGLSMEIVY